MVTEFAPFGVVAAITPTTNPTSTIINNTIAIVSAGNSLVFNVHPNAKRVSAENIRLINRAVVAAGGPENLVTAIPEPTIESAKELMHHPDVRLLLVTGGPAVVREALKTDKRAVTAGPGNPPAVVDQTADVDKAGRDIVRRRLVRQQRHLHRREDDDRRGHRRPTGWCARWASNGAYVLKEHELRRLERVIFTELGPPNRPGHVNPAWIGKDAGVILREIGIRVDADVRLAVAEVPREHSLVWTEQMMPVMPRRAGPDRRAGDRPRGAVRARLPPHRVDPLDERRDDHADGAGDELQHLRGERAELLRARPGRRGLLVVLDRESRPETG